MSSMQGTDDVITLLNGFDAMGVFLESYWQKHDRQSDDLAVLLSNIDRGPAGNYPPLDIAQWGDWLDAVLLVRPELKNVQEVRRRIQTEHHEFMRIYENEALSPEEQKRKLDELRVKKRAHSWHRIGEQKLSVLDAYETMQKFLLAYWDRGMKQSRCIGEIVEMLGDRGTIPSAAEWDAWKTAILKVSQKKEPLSGLSIPPRA